MKHSLKDRWWQQEPPTTILKSNWAPTGRNEGGLKEVVKTSYFLSIQWAQPYYHNHKHEIGKRTISETPSLALEVK